MEPFARLVCMVEPASLMLIGTAIFVTFASAYRALDHEKEMERNLDFSEASITIDHSQALVIPIVGSCTLVMMFYLFSSVSQIITAFVAFSSGSALYFCLSPYVTWFISQFGLVDSSVSWSCCKFITRTQGILLLFCLLIVCAWLVTGHWLLNNLFGVCICIAFVSHVRLPNIKICTQLHVCLFIYDIFWVFFSKRFFGENVMVSVTTQSASNPILKVAKILNLPGLQMITSKLEMPVKLVFPRNFTGRFVPGRNGRIEYMMLGLGDMV